MPHLGLYEITDCFSAATESAATVCVLCEPELEQYESKLSIYKMGNHTGKLQFQTEHKSHS